MRPLSPLAFVLLAASLACANPAPEGGVPVELRDPTYLSEIVRHLYRWHLDEHDLRRAAERPGLEVWIRPLDIPMDPGDRSRMVALSFPSLQAVVTVKKTDYRIDELDLEVEGDGFKIVRVARETLPDVPPEEAEVVRLDPEAMLRYLFETRRRAVYPEGALADRLRTALEGRISEEDANPDNRTEVVHISPISPVANELWIYWETGGKLIRIASDIDLANPAVWDHERLSADIFDIEQQVVVSFDEAPGSNAYLTRDHVGRILYNCMVHGRRREVDGRAAAATAAPPDPVDER